MDFLPYVTDHATSIAALATALGSIVISQRKLSITTAKENAERLKEDAEKKARQIRDEVSAAANSIRKSSSEAMTELKNELKIEIKKYEGKWIECEERDTDNKVQIGSLKTELSGVKERLDDCEQNHRAKPKPTARRKKKF